MLTIFAIQNRSDAIRALTVLELTGNMIHQSLNDNDMTKHLPRLISGFLPGKFRLLLPALILASLCAQLVQAKDYGLYIAGVSVTDENKSDLSVIDGVSGTVSYDPGTQTLRLKDATIYKAYWECVYNHSVPGLIIEVEGKCSLTSAGTYAAVSMGEGLSVTIAGAPGEKQSSLKLSSDIFSGLYVRTGAHCTIRDIELTSTGKRGICGSDVTVESLTIERATVHATGREGSICNFKSITFKDCDIIAPLGATVSNGMVALNNAVVTDEVIIGITEKYGFKVCGIDVTDANIDKLSSFPGVKGGSITYYPQAKDLWLKDAEIESANGCIVNDSVASLNIFVEGKCSLNAGDKASVPPMVLKEATFIGGKNGTDNSLSVSAVNTGAMDIYGKCNIQNMNITATGKWGFSGSGNAKEELYISNSTIRAKGEKGSICDLGKVTLSGCGIVSPEGATFDGGTLKLNGQTVTDEVLVSPIYYVLNICGVQVTNGNKNDLSVINGVSGTVSFSSFTKTLRLKDAVIETKGTGIENISVDGLTIEVEGNCKINAENGGISLHKPTAIKGSSDTGLQSLTLTSPQASALLADNGAECTIRNLELSANGKQAISGNAAEELIIDRSIVRAKGAEGSVLNFKSATLKGCEVITPEGAAFDGGTLKLDGNTVTDEVLIAPKELYGLWICGVQITDANKDKLSDIAGVKSGTVSYNPATKTLLLTNAEMEHGNGYGIKNASVAGLTIRVEGKCEIKSESQGIGLSASTTITGTSESSLTVSATGNSGTAIEADASLTIRDINLTATGENCGIAGGNAATLAMENATVHAKGSKGGSIVNFKSATLKGCKVTTPEGADFDGGTLKLNGKTVTDEAVIALHYGNDYDLYFIGVQVTDLNKDKLSGISGVKSGTVSYDPDTKTLHLKNAVVETRTSIIVNEGVDNLTIKAEGTCSLTVTRGGGMPVFTKGDELSTIITGISGTERPSLVLSSYFANPILQLSSAPLTIRNINLTATSQAYGIEGSGGALAIEYSTVHVNCNVGSISGFGKSVTLKGCKIATPEGAEFDDGTLKLNGKTVMEEVLIVPDGTVGINTATSRKPNREIICTPDGVRLTTTFDKLPRGIYIVNGKKIIKK